MTKFTRSFQNFYQRIMQELILTIYGFLLLIVFVVLGRIIMTMKGIHFANLTIVVFFNFSLRVSFLDILYFLAMLEVASLQLDEVK